MGGESFLQCFAMAGKELESIAFIPDGNRRFARKAGVNFLKAYQLGTRKAWDVMHWLEEYPRITAGTFWMLSLENAQKRKAELGLLFKIFDSELDKVKKSGYFEENQVRLKFFGRLEMLPKSIMQKVRETEEFTQDFGNRTINLALGYSGRAEILDAAKALALDAQQGRVDLESVDEKAFESYLYTEMPSPDMIVRTSGEQRTSGFLAYQSGYSELHFCSHYWPEFSEQDLANAVADYDLRKRNFGK